MKTKMFSKLLVTYVTLVSRHVPHEFLPIYYLYTQPKNSVTVFKKHKKLVTSKLINLQVKNNSSSRRNCTIILVHKNIRKILGNVCT